MGSDSTEKATPGSLILPRRAVLGGALALSLPALPAAAASGRLAFNVFRESKKVGQHVVTLQAVGEDTIAHTEANFVLILGPLGVIHYTYGYSATERWRGAKFLSLETRTNANGEKIKVTAQPTGRGVQIQSSKLGAITLPADAVPLAHWNMAAVRAPLFNPQDGKTLKLTASRRQEVFTPFGGGRPVNATRISLTGEDPIDDWYDASGAWIGLKGKIKDGSYLEYRRV